MDRRVVLVVLCCVDRGESEYPTFLHVYRDDAPGRTSCRKVFTNRERTQTHESSDTDDGSFVQHEDPPGSKMPDSTQSTNKSPMESILLLTLHMLNMYYVYYTSRPQVFSHF